MPQLLCLKPSLSGLDRLTFSLFFVWGIVSVLFGGIVGGSILTALSPEFINQPSACAGHLALLHPWLEHSWMLASGPLAS